MKTRIVERQLKVCENKPYVWSTIGTTEIEDDFYSIDDTLKIVVNITRPCKPDAEMPGLPPWTWLGEYEKELTIIRATYNPRHVTIYKRDLLHANMGGIFQRYRIPFELYELAQFNEKTDPDWNTNPQYDLNKLDYRLGLYDGNPDLKLSRRSSIDVSILTPFEIVPEHSSISLEIKENRTHPTQKQIRVVKRDPTT